MNSFNQKSLHLPYTSQETDMRKDKLTEREGVTLNPLYCTPRRFLLWKLKTLSLWILDALIIYMTFNNYIHKIKHNSFENNFLSTLKLLFCSEKYERFVIHLNKGKTP